MRPDQSPSLVKNSNLQKLFYDFEKEDSVKVETPEKNVSTHDINRALDQMMAIH